MPIIETFGLSKKFKDTIAVDALTLSVEKGEVLGFLGPNGAGKTTTIRMLAGMIAPTGGYATVNGIRTDKDLEKLHEIIGLLTESPGFYENLSARVNLEYYAGFYPGIDVPAQVEKYLRLVGLWEQRERRAGAYSRGMKQRLALARALVHEPGGVEYQAVPGILVRVRAAYLKCRSRGAGRPRESALDKSSGQVLGYGKVFRDSMQILACIPFQDVAS